MSSIKKHFFRTTLGTVATAGPATLLYTGVLLWVGVDLTPFLAGIAFILVVGYVTGTFFDVRWSVFEDIDA